MKTDFVLSTDIKFLRIFKKDPITQESKENL